MKKPHAALFKKRCGIEMMQNILDHIFISQVHPEWRDAIREAYTKLDPLYLQTLNMQSHCLPRPDQLFAAFSMPLSSMRYILLGESPYPRVQSANGYAFWDAAVGSLWSDKGLSKEVNRATSLRNLIKMLLVARGSLSHDFSQDAIAKLDQSSFVQTGSALFERMMSLGFLLLNASLVYSDGQVNHHAKQWRPFIQCILEWLVQHKPSVELILFGKIANNLPKTALPIALKAEHPYNLTFITNPNVIDFFKPMDILKQS